jgi:hypothetical protein
MVDERPKPTKEQREWFEKAIKEMTSLKKEIELGKSRKDFFNFTITLINPAKYDSLGKAKHDQRIIEVARDEDILIAEKAIIRLETWERVIELSGICRQCGGTGYHDPFSSFRSGGPPLNETTPTCDKCWGSGWENAPSPSPFDGLKPEDFGLKAEEKK